MNIKCYVKPRPGISDPGYEALIIGVVQSEPYVWEDYSSGINKEHLPKYTTKALVKLETFSKGTVHEIPWSKVSIVDEYYHERD